MAFDHYKDPVQSIRKLDQRIPVDASATSESYDCDICKDLKGSKATGFQYITTYHSSALAGCPSCTVILEAVEAAGLPSEVKSRRTSQLDIALGILDKDQQLIKVSIESDNFNDWFMLHIHPGKPFIALDMIVLLKIFRNSGVSFAC